MSGEAVDASVEAEANVAAGLDRRFYLISAEALRRARRARLLTQLQLAEASGVTASTISQAESGSRRQVRALTLARLAEALDIAPGELMAGLEEDREEAGDER